MADLTKIDDTTYQASEFEQGVNTGEQQVWKTGVTSKHFIVEGDFNDVNTKSNNGCVGFIIGNMPDDAPFNENYGVCFFATGNGNAGYTSHCKWWTLNPAPYTVAEGEGNERFAHIKVEWTQTEDNITAIFTCNDKVIEMDQSKLIAEDSRFAGLELTPATKIVITMKCSEGIIKNLKFTDLEETTTTDPGTGEGGNKETGAASIVIAMTALVSLAAVTVVAKKRH